MGLRQLSQPRAHEGVKLLESRRSRSHACSRRRALLESIGAAARMHAQDGALSSAHPTQVKLVEQVLRWGLELVLTDVDALVLREPFEYMDR